MKKKWLQFINWVDRFLENLGFLIVDLLSIIIFIAIMFGTLTSLFFLIKTIPLAIMGDYVPLIINIVIIVFLVLLFSVKKIGKVNNYLFHLLNAS